MGKKGRKKGEQAQGTCVYCGTEGPITDDHVFPEVIFLALDEQMVTVPACDKGRQIKSLGDRDLRNYILMDVGGSTHPDAIDMAARMLKESNVRLRNWVRKQIDTAKEVEFVTDTGVIVSKGIEFDFNMDRIMVAQEMVVRGLHYHEKSEILSPDCPVDVQHIPWQHAPKFVQGISAKTRLNPKIKGKNVAWWTSNPMDGYPADSSGWFVCYNGWVLFLGTTGDAALLVQRLRAERTTDAQDPDEIEDSSPKRVVVPRDHEGRPVITPM